jgi:hypothetical protein
MIFDTRLLHDFFIAQSSLRKDRVHFKWEHCSWNGSRWRNTSIACDGFQFQALWIIRFGCRYCKMNEEAVL